MRHPSTKATQNYNSVSMGNTELSNNNIDLDKVRLAELGFHQENVDDFIPWVQESLVTINRVHFQLKQLRTDKKGVYQIGVVSENDVELILNGASESTLDRAKKRAPSKRLRGSCQN